jgi:hypothetical protein
MINESKLISPVEKRALESNPSPCESQPKPRPETKKKIN